MADDDQTADMLARLAGRSMLQFDAATGRYSMPREVLEFVRSHGDDAAIAEARQRLVAWASKWADQAGAAERSASESAWLARFAVDHAHLESAARIDPLIVDRACWCWIRAGRAGVVDEFAQGCGAKTRDRLATAARGSSGGVTYEPDLAFDSSLERVAADLRAGELARAWEGASALLADRRSVGDEVGEAEVLVAVSSIALERDRATLAQRFADSAVAGAQSLHAGGVLGSARVAQARALRVLGQTIASAGACRAAVAIARSGRLAGLAREALAELSLLAGEQQERQAREWQAIAASGEHGEGLWDAVTKADQWARARGA